LHFELPHRISLVHKECEADLNPYFSLDIEMRFAVESR
jgi:hypothetical protein